MRGNHAPSPLLNERSGSAAGNRPEAILDRGIATRPGC